MQSRKKIKKFIIYIFILLGCDLIICLITTVIDVIYYTGNKFEGDWINDKREGKGKIIYEKNRKEDIFEGIFVMIKLKENITLMKTIKCSNLVMKNV